MALNSQFEVVLQPFYIYTKFPHKSLLLKSNCNIFFRFGTLMIQKAYDSKEQRRNDPERNENKFL